MAEAVPAFTATSPKVRRIELSRPWSWLAAGWHDLCRVPEVSLAYGLVFALAGYAITLGLWWADLIYLILPLGCGFLIVGPLLALGLYEVSRRQEAGEPVSLNAAVMAWQRNGGQIGLMGIVLLLLLFAWIRLAALLFMLFFGLEPPSFPGLFAGTFLNPDALPFLIVGTVIGAVLAALAFAISATSIPFLLDRPDSDVFTAIATSVTAVKENPTAMLFWAALVAGFAGAGLITLFLGLIVTLPLIGHATWHAYRDLVENRA